MEFWATARDIVIVVFGVLAALSALVSIVVMLMVLSLVRKIDNNVAPTLESTRVTASTIQATVRFVSEMVVRPIASAAGAVVALGKLVQVLLGGSPKRKGGK